MVRYNWVGLAWAGPGEAIDYSAIGICKYASADNVAVHKCSNRGQH